MRALLSAADRALIRAGVRITRAIGTMWAALAFTALALVSLPGALAAHNLVVLVGWIAQTFLQLVLLAVIMVGQAAEAARVEARDLETHDAVMAEHAAAALRDAELVEVLTDVRAIVAKVAAQ